MDYSQKIFNALQSSVIPLTNSSADYDALFECMSDARVVLLGEATHGTHQFYDIRAQITQQLIIEKGFNAIAIEGDWPDAYQINRYIHHEKYTRAVDALAAFDRFPTWMWRNVPMLQLSEWLRDYNRDKSSENQISFYGLDVYSLYRSIDVVIACLKKVDPAAAAEAQYHYSCFDRYRYDPQAYAYAVFTKAMQSCADAVIEQLKRLQEQTWGYLEHGEMSADEAFNVEQNARVVKNAEDYYRSLFISEKSNWNLRDSHMFETLDAIIKHYQAKGIDKPKVVIWAHNSHIGNAAATQMGEHGEYNIGQLAKEHFGKEAVLVGFTTYHGTVSAASDWHKPVERKNVREALPESYEALFHAIGIPNFLLLLKNKTLVPAQLLERAIGVIYHPQTERVSHYFHADLANQFDAVIHCDKTTAIEPLEKTSQWIKGEVPETYPSGL